MIRDIPNTPESFKRYTTSSSSFSYFARQIPQNRHISTIAFHFDVLRIFATGRKPMSLGLTDSRWGALPTPRNRAPLPKMKHPESWGLRALIRLASLQERLLRIV
jgi:hypothetical protein